MNRGLTVGELAAAVGGHVEGDAEARIVGFNSLADAQSGEISFLANPKYLSHLATTGATAVLAPRLPTPAGVAVRAGLILIRVANPDHAFAQVVARFAPKPVHPPAGVHPTAVIGEGVRLGADVAIGAYAVIGDGCSIGDRAIIHPHVVVGAACELGPDALLYPMVSVRERCRIGARVTLHNGCVIGADGFGYTTVDGEHHKIPQVGIVVIEDDVEIGANTTIDRARFGRTRIGRGTKIDNLVQIAHNVDVGAHGIIVAQAAVAGSTRLGDHVTLAGQVGVVGHITIGDRAMIGAQAGVTKSVPPGLMVRGTPAQDIKQYQAQEIAARRMTATMATIKELERRLAELERRLSGKEAP